MGLPLFSLVMQVDSGLCLHQSADGNEVPDIPLVPRGCWPDIELMEPIMSRGHDRHQERHHGLSLYGKDLVRRCGSHCELCDAQGVRLNIYEVPPVGAEPEFDHCIMICATCSQQLDKPKQRDANHWRCLNHSVWSQVPAVKVMAVAMLRALSDEEPWAGELLEQVYLDTDEKDWAGQVEL